MKSLVNRDFNLNTLEYTITINKVKIQDIVLNKLKLKDKFTLKEIKTKWDKNVFDLGHWHPGDIFVEQSLNEFVGTSLTKTFISVGSKTVMQYKIK